MYYNLISIYSFILFYLCNFGQVMLIPTTLVVPNVKKIWGLNLPRTPLCHLGLLWETFTFTFYSFTMYDRVDVNK
jgi:hypothetical protein